MYNQQPYPAIAAYMPYLNDYYNRVMEKILYGESNLHGEVVEAIIPNFRGPIKHQCLGILNSYYSDVNHVWNQQDANNLLCSALEYYIVIETKKYNAMIPPGFMVGHDFIKHTFINPPMVTPPMYTPMQPNQAWLNNCYDQAILTGVRMAQMPEQLVNSFWGAITTEAKGISVDIVSKYFQNVPWDQNAAATLIDYCVSYFLTLEAQRVNIPAQQFQTGYNWVLNYYRAQNNPQPAYAPQQNQYSAQPQGYGIQSAYQPQYQQNTGITSALNHTQSQIPGYTNLPLHLQQPASAYQTDPGEKMVDRTSGLVRVAAATAHARFLYDQEQEQKMNINEHLNQPVAAKVIPPVAQAVPVPVTPVAFTTPVPALVVHKLPSAIVAKPGNSLAATMNGVMLAMKDISAGYKSVDTVLPMVTSTVSSELVDRLVALSTVEEGEDIGNILREINDDHDVSGIMITVATIINQLVDKVLEYRYAIELTEDFNYLNDYTACVQFLDDNDIRFDVESLILEKIHGLFKNLSVSTVEAYVGESDGEVIRSQVLVSHELVPMLAFPMKTQYRKATKNLITENDLTVEALNSLYQLAFNQFKENIVYLDIHDRTSVIYRVYRHGNRTASSPSNYSVFTRY